jgi:hypothetical protein
MSDGIFDRFNRQVENRFRRLHAANSTYQPFKEFQSMYGKKSASTVGQLFGHQLRQIQGCSTSVAVTLMDRYGTTARFMAELEALGQAKAEVCRSQRCAYGGFVQTNSDTLRNVLHCSIR